MAIIPINDKILVKREEPEETTAGGLLLPDSAKEAPRQGKVASLGDGKQLQSGKKVPFQVKEGDRVLFASYAGNEIIYHDQEYLILTEDDILAILE